MDEKPQKSDRGLVIFLLVLVAILFLLGWSQASLNLSFIRPRNATETILLVVLSAVVFVAFVIFALILGRILLKVYVERRQNQLGSRFKTKMVVAFLGLSLVPVCFLLFFSYGLLNRSINNWFGIPFDTVRRDASAITRQLALQSQQAALDSADHLAALPELQRDLRAGGAGVLTLLLERQVGDLRLESALCLNARGGLVSRAGSSRPGISDLVRIFGIGSWNNVPPAGQTAQARYERSELSLAAYPVFGPGGAQLGTVIAIRQLPLNIQQIATQIQREAQQYDQLSREKKALKRVYLLILLLLALLILFVATWFAMFFSKQVTVPIQALAEATHELSKGNLGWQISVRADAELGSLIRLFNDMTVQLQESRRIVERTADELQRANQQLEERSNTMEAILENVPTGVISFDPDEGITKINSTAERMFGLAGAEGVQRLTDLLPSDEAHEVSRLFRRAGRQGVVNRQLSLRLAGRRAFVGLTLSAISAQHGAVGFVMVLEDLTELMKAQRSAAWREVAQRVAHEIKNPLTPIQLSAERIRRLVGKSDPDSAQPHLLSAVADSSSLIQREVATLKALVDEFSEFARFPSSQPVSSDLNGIIENALEVFEGRLSDISLHRDLARDLPAVKADPEQMKRAVVNLIDNAAEALEHAPLKEIWVRTRDDPDHEVVFVVVADSGPGIQPEAKERLFLPFFSTKQRGTGLGLAIVSRIISEHNGLIRVEENWPTGTQFIIELPVECAAAFTAEAVDTSQ
jgi:two-component system, NtrC family, nitrogen regulation sensor histidine kinase NtrY